MSVDEGQTTAAQQNTQPVEQQTAAPSTEQDTTTTPTTTTNESNWRDSLPDELKMDASLLKFNDVPSLAKSYVNAQRLIGADKIALPSEHATDDEWLEVYDKLGRPQDAKNYDLKYEGESDDQLIGAFAETAHGLGLNNKQAQGLLEFYNKLATDSVESMTEAASQATDDGLADLKKEWGRAFDQKAKQAVDASRILLDDREVFDQVKLEDGRMLGDHPAIIKMFAKLAEQLPEDTIKTASSEQVMTPDEAMRRVAELTAPNSPYWDKRHPQHQSYIDQALALREQALPSENDDVLSP